MKLKVIQNHSGNYNLLRPNETTWCFKMGIFDDANNLIQNEQGHKAIIEYNAEEEHNIFHEPFTDISEVFDICFEDCNKYLGSSKINNCILFKKLYDENFEELDDNYMKQYKIDTEKEIERLESKIKSLKNDLQAESLLYPSKIESSKIDRYNNLRLSWIKSSEEKLKDLIPGSPSYIKESEYIEMYQKQIIH